MTHPSLQTLKNALSPYKLGGAAGGSDFDPKGKSDNEVNFQLIQFDLYFCSFIITKCYFDKLADYAILPKFHEWNVSLPGAWQGNWKHMF